MAMVRAFSLRTRRVTCTKCIACRRHQLTWMSIMIIIIKKKTVSYLHLFLLFVGHQSRRLPPPRSYSMHSINMQKWTNKLHRKNRQAWIECNRNELACLSYAFMCRALFPAMDSAQSWHCVNGWGSGERRTLTSHACTNQSLWPTMKVKMQDTQ